MDPRDAAAVARMTGVNGGLFDSSPAGFLFGALIVFTVMWLAHRLWAIGTLQARLSKPSQVWLAALTAGVAYAQWIKLRREIDAWMKLAPADRGILVVPSEVVSSTGSGNGGLR